MKRSLPLPRSFILFPSVLLKPIHTRRSDRSRTDEAQYFRRINVVCVMPPPTSPMLLPDTPDSTPEPSISSSTSRKSSRTREDGEESDSQHPPAVMSSFWRARPAIHIATKQRSVSVTPPPTPPMLLPDTPDSTPGPSPSTSCTSSKRSHTPEDGEECDSQHHGVPIGSSPAQRRRRRAAVKKGWKGWVEGSPPPPSRN